MDQALLVAAAEKLENLMLRYSAADARVRHLHGVLSEVIDDARNGRILTPLEWGDVPGSYGFTEGQLRQYRDLEAAYARFRVEITGGESPVLRALRFGEALGS
jgi:hypothetical protein